MSQPLKYLFSLVFLCLFTACSKKKNTFSLGPFTTQQHIIIGILMRGELKSTIKKLEDKHQEDYNQLLPIFPIGTQKTRLASPSLDKAIKKGAKAINSIQYLLKERSTRWVDDCYLMIAKSYFFKRICKSNRSIPFHRPSIQRNRNSFEAQLWLCRSYIDKGDLSSAENYIQHHPN